MKIHLFCLLITGFFFVSSNGVEVSTLLALKSSLVNPMDHLKDWSLAKNGSSLNSVYCKWTGVFCNSESYVERLDLSNMNLSSKVSDQIQGLQSLSSLNLCCNDFSTSLPKSLANLTSLKSIDVSQNNFV
ncbi:hypothetical protein P3S67_017405 [Capsicum chacoense]